MNKPCQYLLLLTATTLIGCRPQGLQPLVPTEGLPPHTAAVGASSEVAVTIRWPYRAQVLPTSAQHLSFRLAGPTAQTVDVFRPDGTSPTSVATLSVDVGMGYTLTVEAYDNAPTPRLVASGTSSPFDVRSNERTDVAVTLATAYVPTVTGFKPDNGGPGSTVEIYGTNFGAERGLTPGFTFGGVPVTTIYPQIEGGTVSVLVPNTAISGLVLPLVDGVSGPSSGSFTVLRALGIDPPSLTVASGSSALFTARATTSEGVPFEATPSVSWSVSAPITGAPVANFRIQGLNDGIPDTSTASVALGTIDQQGRFTGTATGSAQITILSGTLIATASITVTE